MVSGRYPLTSADEALSAVEKQTAIKAIITPNPKLTEGGKGEAARGGTR